MPYSCVYCLRISIPVILLVCTILCSILNNLYCVTRVFELPLCLKRVQNLNLPLSIICTMRLKVSEKWKCATLLFSDVYLLCIYIYFFFSPSCVYSILKIKYIHTRHSYKAFIHHSVAPIILLRNPESNNIYDLDRHSTQNRDYLLDCYYSWDTI